MIIPFLKAFPLKEKRIFNIVSMVESCCCCCRCWLRLCHSERQRRGSEWSQSYPQLENIPTDDCSLVIEGRGGGGGNNNVVTTMHFITDPENVGLESSDLVGVVEHNSNNNNTDTVLSPNISQPQHQQVDAAADDNEGGTTECCHRSPMAQHESFPTSVLEFFRHLGERVLRNTGNDGTGTVAVDTSEHSYNRVDSSEPHPTYNNIRVSRKHISRYNTPLHPARSFDSSTSIPTIGAHEVVLPGSDLQKDMARLMTMAKFDAHSDIECVICMEGFDPTNPRMPTHCGCGDNATYFHLPCLFQWTEQSSECPSCRQTLTWEEFA